MDLGATAGRCGLHPDVERASEQSAACNQWRHRSADRYEQLALAVVAAVGVVIWVAAFAVLGALRTRYSRRIVTPLLLLYGLALVWLAVGVRVDPETASQFHVDVVYGAMRWIAAAAMVFTTVYVCWIGFAERVLTIRYASGAVLVSVAFGAAWVTVLRVAGVQLGRHTYDGRRLDAVAGAAASDGQRPGALVVQPHSPYVTPGRAKCGFTSTGM